MPDIALPIVGVTPGPLYAEMVNEAISDVNAVIDSGRLSENALINSIGTISPEITGGLYVSQSRFPSLVSDPVGTLNAVMSGVLPGTKVTVQPGRYSCAGTINIPPEKSLTLDLSGVTLVRESGTSTLLSCVGNYESQISVSSISYSNQSILGVNTGVSVLTTSSATNYAPGDIVKLFSDDPIPGGRQTTSSSFPRMGEHMLVLAASGTTLTLNGSAFERENYMTNVRVARISPGTVRVVGASFDVSDDIFNNGTTSATVIRMQSLISPVLSNISVLRSVGPSIQLRSSINYRVENARVGWAQNNGGTILGYGIQDNGSQGGLVLGGDMRFVRHAYDDKSYDLDANDPYTPGYGRTLFTKVIGVSTWYTSAASFSTHQESYGVMFENCSVRGTGLVGAFSLRGSGHKVASCYASNVDSGVSVATETGYATGESRNIHVSDLTVENAVYAVTANIRLGSTHQSSGIQDTEQSITVDGLVARNVRGVLLAQNAKVDLFNYRAKLADNPAKHLIDDRNSAILLGGTQWIDGLGVTVTDAADCTLIRASSPAESSSVRNRIIQTGSLNFEPSTYYAARFTGGLVVIDSNTDIDFPSNDSLNVYTVISGGIFSASTFRKQCTFGWRYVPHADFPARYDGSGSITATNSQLAGNTAVSTLTAAPDENLLLVASMPDNTDRTLAVLPTGRRRGQRLMILRAGGTANLLVRNGVTGGTTLTGGADLSLANGASLQLVWVGSSWRQVGV